MKKLVVIDENLSFFKAIKLIKELNAKQDGRNYYYTSGRIEDPDVKRQRKYRWVKNYAVYCYIDE